MWKWPTVCLSGRGTVVDADVVAGGVKLQLKLLLCPLEQAKHRCPFFRRRVEE